MSPAINFGAASNPALVRSRMIEHFIKEGLKKSALIAQTFLKQSLEINLLIIHAFNDLWTIVTFM